MKAEELPLRLNGSVLTRTCAVFDSKLSRDDWLAIWRSCRAVDGCLNWIKGDWFNHGRHFLTCVGAVSEDDVSAAISELIPADGPERKTLRNLAWVARRVPPSRRREALSWSHHAEVAALPEAEQERLLKAAIAKAWSRADLREHISGRLRQDSLAQSCAGPGFIPLRWANEFLRWSESDLASWTPVRRQALAKQLRPLLERLQALYSHL